MAAPIEKFLKEVAKGKYGESELSQDDVKKFMKRATKSDIKEVEDDFYLPFTTNDGEVSAQYVSALDTFIQSTIAD